MEFKEIQLEDVVCRSGKCVPLKDALGQPGPWDGLLHSHPDFHGGEGGILGAGRGTEKAPCCLRWAPFEGRIKMLFGHTRRQERGQEGDRGSWMEGRRQLCMCARALEGRGREQGAKPEERRSQEKAAIVKAGQLRQGPEEAAQEESKSFLLCVCRRAKKRRGRDGRSGGGEMRNRRGERSIEKKGRARGGWLWTEYTDAATHPAKIH